MGNGGWLVRPVNLLAAGMAVGASCADAGIRPDPVLVVHDEALSAVHPQLFGQFLERSSNGEPGPEAIVQEGGQLPPIVRDRLREMRIPVLRFPGGTDVDFTDWRDMIDHVPGRADVRPVSGQAGKSISNRFGYGEYFTLRDELGCETILVVNLMDAVLRKKPLRQAAMDAVGLLAYSNAEQGAALPEGMPDWPATRAQGGHSSPFRCEYVQIGNEWRFKHRQIAEATGLQPGPELARWLQEVLHEYLTLIQAVDPEVKIIIDGELGGEMAAILLADARIRAAIHGLAVHVYAPGSLERVRRDGQPIDPRQLAEQEWWYALCAIPGHLDAEGQVQAVADRHRQLSLQTGLPLMVTEWNWNGWNLVQVVDPAIRDQVAMFQPAAQALGAAGFLHGLMRQGDAIALATQSMLLGSHWGITSLRVDPTGKQEPWFLPQGLVTDFYRQRHGARLLCSEAIGVSRRAQPVIAGEWTRWPTGPAELAQLDMVVSADERRVFVHVIHRHLTNPTGLRIDVRALGLGDAAATLHVLTWAATRKGRLGFGRLQAQPVQVASGVCRLTLPPAALAILEVHRP